MNQDNEKLCERYHDGVISLLRFRIEREHEIIKHAQEAIRKLEYDLAILTRDSAEPRPSATKERHEGGQPMTALNHAICPGCGWHGTLADANEGACPRCEYEVGNEPYRLLTLAEMRACDHGATWCDVDIRAFLRAVAEVEGAR